MAMIGQPLWVDAHTFTWGRSSYARVCVRLNLAQKLEPGVFINGLKGRFFQPVEYEGISFLCFRCGKIGHKDTSCPTIERTKGKEQVLNKEGGSSNPKRIGGPMLGQDRVSRREGKEVITDGDKRHDGMAAASGYSSSVGPIGTELPPDRSMMGDGDKESLGLWTLVQRKRRPLAGVKLTRGGNSASGNPASVGASVRGGNPVKPLTSQDSRSGEPGGKGGASVDAGPTDKAPSPPVDHPDVSRALIVHEKPPPGRRHGTRERSTKAAVGKELLRLGPAPSLPKKQRKSLGDMTDGGDASPLVN